MIFSESRFTPFRIMPWTRLPRATCPHRVSDASHDPRRSEPQPIRLRSRLDVGPALLLQLHDVDDPGLDKLSLRNDRDTLVLRLLHVLLRIAAGLVGNLGRTQRQ